MVTLAPGVTGSPLPSFTSQISRPDFSFFHSLESSGGRTGSFLSSPIASGASTKAARANAASKRMAGSSEVRRNEPHAVPVLPDYVFRGQKPEARRQRAEA